MANEINLAGVPPDPDTFKGPLNVLIQLQGTAAAYVRTLETKQAYDNIVPTPAPAAAKEPPPLTAPIQMGAPISAGRRITPDPDKYVTDRIKQRLA